MVLNQFHTETSQWKGKILENNISLKKQTSNWISVNDREQNLSAKEEDSIVQMRKHFWHILGQATKLDPGKMVTFQLQLIYEKRKYYWRPRWEYRVRIEYSLWQLGSDWIWVERPYVWIRSRWRHCLIFMQHKNYKSHRCTCVEVITKCTHRRHPWYKGSCETGW